MCLSCQFIPPAATPAAKASIRSITVSSVLSVSLKPKGKKKKRHNRKRKIDDDDAGDGVACREDGDAVNKNGIVYVRPRSCWCIACMKALMDGTLGWGANSYSVPNCSAISSGSGINTSLYTFVKCDIEKKTGPGVAKENRERRKHRNEVATKLSVGDWVLFDGEDVMEPIWLGRVISNPEWQGQGVLQNTTTRTRKYAGNAVEIEKNEVALFVMWYEKIDVNSVAFDYHASRTITTPQIQSNRYLIHSGFDMHRVIGSSNPVPRSRPRSARAGRSRGRGVYDPPIQNLQTSNENWHDREYGLVWKMDECVQWTALSRCDICTR